MIKSVLTASAKAGVWLCLFIVSQTITMIGYMWWKIYHDMNFADHFVELFTPILEMENYGQKQLMTMQALSELMRGEMGLVLGISSLFIILVTTIVIGRGKTKVLKPLKFQTTIQYLWIGVLMNLVLTIVITFLPQRITVLYDTTTSLAVSNGLFVDLMITGLLVPVAEEMIFRYGILRSMDKVNNKFAIVYQALIFGILHGNVIQGTYAFLLGLVFGLIYKRTNNLTNTILLHIGINMSSVIVVYCFKNEIVGLVLLSFLLGMTYCKFHYLHFLQNKYKIGIEK